MLVLSLIEKKPITKTDITNINKIRYDSYYRKKLHDCYVNYHVNIQKDDKLDFEDWLNQHSIDLEYKKYAYIDSQAVIFKRKFTLDSPEVIYEFLPDITLNKKELRGKLLKDKSLALLEKIEIKNYDEFQSRLEPLDKHFKNKTLHYSIDLFKKFNQEVAMVLYNEKDNEFYILRKKLAQLIPEFVDTEQ